jgi:predicted PurR-regulated permease PerM
MPIDISYKAIFKVLSVFFILFILLQVVDVLVIVFMSVVISSAIKPVVNYMTKVGLPRGLSIFFVLFSFFALFGTLLFFGITPIITQISNFVNNFGQFLDTINRNYNLQIQYDKDSISKYLTQFTPNIGSTFGNASNQIISLGRGFLNGLLFTLALLVLTFYQLLEENKISDFVASLFHSNSGNVKNIIKRSENKLGAWFRGQLSLMLFIGIITFLGLSILSFFNPALAEFALPLALIAGVLEIVPVLGPALALIPALFVGATISLQFMIAVLVLYLVIQQIETNVVIPRVMNRAVGIDPVIVIIGIMVGNTLMGPLGSLLSVPVMAVLSVMYEEWKNNSEK